MKRGVLVLLIVIWAVGCGGSRPIATPSATRDPESPYQTTREEFLLRVKACIEEKGFPVTLDLADGGFLFPPLGTDDRVQLAKVAMKECMVTIDPSRLKPPPPVSEKQLRTWYGYRLRQVDCLREAGYPPPVAPPEQVFVDTEGDWDPFEALLDAGSPASQTDMSRCQHIEGGPNFLNW